jgi:GT2 family glycosyltransferase
VQGRTIPDPAVPMRSLTRSVRVEGESPIFETANIFYRREAFEQAGGFEADMTPDAAHPMGGEDVDLGWKVKRLGWATGYAAAALATHAVLPITPKQWLINRQCYVFPRIVARHPELRSHFFAHYFYDDVQAWLMLGLLGTALLVWQPWAALAWLPYIWRRAGEDTRAFGPLRLLRPLLYLPRDLCAFALLLAGSLRFRALVL